MDGGLLPTRCKRVASSCLQLGREDSDPGPISMAQGKRSGRDEGRSYGNSVHVNQQACKDKSALVDVPQMLEGE